MDTVMELMREVSALLWLTALGLCDYKTRSVPVWSLLLMAVCGTCFLVPELIETEGSSFLSSLAAFLPGLCLLVASWIFGGRIGAADGWTVLVLGCFAGAGDVFTGLMYALIFCGIAGLILLLGKRKGRTDSLPFLPFLSAGYVVALIF